MSRCISSIVVLSYSLRRHASISSDSLLSKRKKIASAFNDILADVSFCSMREATRIFNDSIDISSRGGSFSVSKKHKKGKAIKNSENSEWLFDDEFIDQSMRALFTPDECNRIKKILGE